MDLVFADRGEQVVAMLEAALRDESGSATVVRSQRLPSMQGQLL